jgi:hypothetical protein
MTTQVSNILPIHTHYLQPKDTSNCVPYAIADILGHFGLECLDIPISSVIERVKAHNTRGTREKDNIEYLAD